MVKPNSPKPSAESPDDDPTGVRALLSALPEPDPMPEHLVSRINASLAAEQAHRAADTSGALVIPLLDTARRRSGKLLFAIAGAAAAVALVAVVASNMFMTNDATTLSSTAAIESQSSTDSPGVLSDARENSGAAPPRAADKAVPGRAATPALVQIHASTTRYTQGGFVAQARVLLDASFDARLDTPQPSADVSSGSGVASTAPGLRECLKAIGAADAQAVRADLALYEGRPAVIIVATTDGRPVAFAVGRQCAPTEPAILHAPTPLP